VTGGYAGVTRTFSGPTLWHELRGARLGVDGGYQLERAMADASRDAESPRRGFRLLRVSERLVVKRRHDAVAAIRAALAG
jgi:very-short-patch-repair endonuclease